MMTMALSSVSGRVRQADLRTAGTVACALLSVGAGVLHFAVLGEHWQEWWGYGLFFGVSAWLQLAWAAAVVWRPSRTMLLTGAAGNLSIAALWLVTRTAGIPVGPASGEVETAALIDALSSAFELAVVLGALAIALGHFERITLRPVPAALVLAVAAIAVTTLTTVSLVDASGGGGHGAAKGGEHEEATNLTGYEDGGATTPVGTSGRVGNLVVSKAYARESNGDEGAIFLTISNFGAADRLLRATSDAAADVQIHENRVEGATASMHPLDGLDIPAGGFVELKSGGLHLMLLGLRAPLEPGDVVSITFELRVAGTLKLEVPVRDLTATEGGHP